jgi:2-iminobutanoate/2-iminopropanoate deaminase
MGKKFRTLGGGKKLPENVGSFSCNSYIYRKINCIGALMKSVINTPKAPAAIGPYNQATVCRSGHILFTAGQIPLDPVSGKIVGDEIKTQARQVLENLRAILEASGASMHNVLKVNIYVKNLQDYSKLNEVYTTFFPDQPPARVAVEVSRLPMDVLVEMDLIAALER